MASAPASWCAPCGVLPFGSVRSDATAALILYTVGWCTTCRPFVAEFNGLADDADLRSDGIVTGVVDCESWPQFRAWEQLGEFPTAKLYRRSVPMPVEYTGDWRIPQLIRWTREQLGIARPGPAAANASGAFNASVAAPLTAAEGRAYDRAMRRLLASLSARAPGALQPDDADPDDDRGAAAGIDDASLMAAAGSLEPMLRHLEPTQRAELLGRLIPQTRATAPSAEAMRRMSRDLAARAVRDVSLYREARAEPAGTGLARGDELETVAEEIAAEEMPMGIDDAPLEDVPGV